MKKTFINRLIKYSTISWVAFIISFIATPMRTYLYDTSEVGVISLFLTTALVFQVAVLMGQDQLLTRKYYETENRSLLLKRTIIIIFIFWIFSSLLTILMLDFLSELIYSERNTLAVILLALSALPLAIIRMFQQVSKLENKISNFAQQTLMFSLITKILVLVVYFLDKNINSYLIAYTFLAYLTFLLFILKYNKYDLSYILKEKIVFSDLFNDLKYGIPIMISSVFFMSRTLLPRIIMNDSFGLDLVGIYSVAMTLSSSINILYSGFKAYFSAYFFENYESDKSSFNSLHHILTFLIGAAIIGMSMFSLLFVKIFNSNYYLAGAIFPLIMITNMANVISETTVNGINLANKTYLHVIISLVVWVVLFITGILIIPSLGLFGAALSTALSGLIFYLIRTYFGQKYHNDISKQYKTVITFGLVLLSSVFNYFLYGNFFTNIIVQIAFLLVLIAIYNKNIYSMYFYVKNNIGGFYNGFKRKNQK